MHLLVSSFVVLAMFGQADVRARQAELDAAKEQGIPGLNGDDAAVLDAAKHFCGTTTGCAAAFLDGRDRLYALYFDAGMKKAVKKAVAVTRDGEIVDWRAAANRAEPVPVTPTGSSYTSRLDCRSWTDSAGSHSECTLHPADVHTPYTPYSYRRRY